MSKHSVRNSNCVRMESSVHMCNCTLCGGHMCSSSLCFCHSISECCEIKKWLRFIWINCLLPGIHRKDYNVWIRQAYYFYLRAHCTIHTWAAHSIIQNTIYTSSNMLQFTSKSMRFHLTTSWMHTIVILIVVFILNTGKLALSFFNIQYNLCVWYNVIYIVRISNKLNIKCHWNGQLGERATVKLNCSLYTKMNFTLIDAFPVYVVIW